MKCSPILVFLLLLMSMCGCQNHVFYIKPSDSSHCPQEVNASQCYDLTTLVSEGHLSIAPNTSLLFLPGQHFLKHDLNVINAKEFQITHYYDEQSISPASDIEIVCTGYSMRVQNVSLVKMKSIIFQSCGVQLMSVDHSEITDCKWNESRSSAISIQDSNCVISDCQFMNGSCSDCSGGGNFAVRSNVNFTGNNVVSNNSVEEPFHGGGLSLIGSNVLIDGNLTIANNLVIGNLTGYGGGIYAESCRFATTNTSYLLFENNNAGTGGGIVIKGCNSAFNGHIEFSSNSAGGYGGGMAVWYSDNTFNGQVEFSGNSAGHFGGGMAVWYGSDNTFNGQVEFSGNSAGHFGGGMAVWRDSDNTFNEQVDFSDNSAGHGGGAMLVNNGSDNTFNGQVEFSGNSAGRVGGGMIVLIHSNNTFNGQVEFSGNSAGHEGGGMAVRIDSNSTFNGQVEFMGNSAGHNSGGMAVKSDSNNTFNGQVEFSGNSAGHHSGGMSVWDSVSTFNGQVEFSGNSAGGSGGGMTVYNSDNTFNGQVEFTGNSAGGSGGGMIVFDSDNTFNGQVEFTGNSAGDDCGGMAVLYGSNNIFNEQVEFCGNSAGSSDGGMRVWTLSNNTFNGQVEFSGNSAGDGGGGMAVWVYSNNTFNGQVEFSGNSVGIGGGGMAVWTHSNNTFNGQVKFSGNSAGRVGGGMVVWDDSDSTFNGQVEFSGNSADYYGGGMAVFSSDNTFNGQVEFSGNSADTGGGIAVLINAKISFNGHCELINNSATYGGGLSLLRHSHCTINSTALFSGNSAKNSGGSLLVQEESNATFLSVVSISNSTAGREGGGILVREDSLLEMSGVTIIKDSHASSYGGAISLDISELRLLGTSEMTSNSAQYGGAIQAVSSNVHIISGDHCFEDNSAEYGGGMALSGGSSIYISYYGSSLLLLVSEFYFHRLNINFTSNSAEQYGGAIWVESTTYYSCISNTTDPRCFLRGDLIDYFTPHWSDPPNITAINNTAAIAGSNLHGGNLDSCSRGIEPLLLSNDFFESSVSSDPYRVCHCTNNEPDYSKSHHSIEIFSGEQFQLSLVGVGQKNSTVPAVILSYTDPPQPSNDGLVTQSAPGNCKNFSYTITSDNSSVKLMLYPESMCPNTSLEMLTINITIKPCPPGFMIHNESRSCTCDDKLDENIQCDIDSQSFSHQHGVWIGYNQLNEIVIYHSHCPFDYCRQEISNFTLNSSDDQCRYNRSGLICGACSEGYSLTLGGSKCEKCSHAYLALLIPLALAGVVLVLFLLVFKLTVSIGTINGLIFFANIIETNSSIFILPESTIVLKVFIAWLNLNLGINTCLFDGLDMYIKVWLQFVFPFYVFILIGIIIFVSQRSTLVTKLLGSDPVAVLATLILVAYTKLLRAVLTVMSFTYIRGFDGSSTAVWLYDGNVRYLHGKHIPLFMFALLIMLLLIIPYTVILLFAPYLQHHSNNRVLFWINNYRIKTFLNSCCAPLKDKYHSWIGVVLVLRLCLLIVFVCNSLGDPSINLFAIVIAVNLPLIWRMLFGTVYTKWYLDALEIFFLIKLCLFSVSLLYIRNTSGNQRVLADTLVGVAFIVFVAITVYHGWRQLTDSEWWRFTAKPKWQKLKYKKVQGVQKDGGTGESQQKSPQHTKVATTFVELREPLLESN